MITVPTVLLVCGIWPGCSEPRMPGFYRSLDLEIPAPGFFLSASGGIGIQKGRLRSGKREDILPSKATNRRKIIIGPYTPPLPVPAWLRGGR